MLGHVKDNYIYLQKERVFTGENAGCAAITRCASADEGPAAVAKTDAFQYCRSANLAVCARTALRRNAQRHVH